MLIPILALAFYIAFIPHRSYPYLVHIDEWIHMAYSEAILQAQDTTYTEPFTGRGTKNIVTNLELSFQLFWGIFHQISGLSWIAIFRYFPSIIFMITVLSAFVFGRREGFGWEAALFTCLIPTGVGIMGPAFLVPVAMGLLFIPLSLFIIFNFRTWQSYLVIFAFISFVIAIHPPSALLLILILSPFILLNLKDNLKLSLGLALALAFPFLVTLPWIARSGAVKNVINSIFTPQPLPQFIDLPWITRDYGYLPILFALLGTFLLSMKGGKKNYGLILGLLALLLMLTTFYAFHYGSDIMYLRGLPFMMLMTGLVASAGLMGIRRLEPLTMLGIKIKAPLIAQIVGISLSLALVGFTLSIAIPNRQSRPYYHMIEQEDYEAFIWIRENIDESYYKAILDPWKATAFTAVTSKYVYTRTHVAPTTTDTGTLEFLSDGCTDTDFLRKNDISIVYSPEACNNPDLAEVRENIYLLKNGE
ncbi:hypothetical protein ACFLWB_00015 [Chloroflexota bacterium]